MFNSKLFFIFAILLLQPAISYSKVACIVSIVDGPVTFSSKGNNYELIELFTKISYNQIIELPPNSKIRLCFLKSQRIEEWIGPAKIFIKDPISKNLLNQKLPRVLNYDDSQSILKESKILSEQNELIAGQISIRGVIEDDQLNKSKQDELNYHIKKYNSLLSESNSNDLFPEFYYLAILERYGQRATLYKHLLKLTENHKSSVLIKLVENF